MTIFDAVGTGQATDDCHGTTPAALSTQRALTLSRSFKALGDPARVTLLALVAAHEGGEACVCDLTELLGLSQPTVSHHLKVLVDGGFLKREQRGRWAYYQIVDGTLSELVDALTQTLRRTAPMR